jgi:hypothetical protein
VGARLATEISVQFAFNSSDARLKVKEARVKVESASCRIFEVRKTNTVAHEIGSGLRRLFAFPQALPLSYGRAGELSIPRY